MDLSLVSIDEMAEEIAKRSDSFIFACVMNETKDKDYRLIHFSGSKVACLGLSEVVSHVLRNKLESKEEDFI